MACADIDEGRRQSLTSDDTSYLRFHARDLPVLRTLASPLHDGDNLGLDCMDARPANACPSGEGGPGRASAAGHRRVPCW